jgi:azurin
MFTKLVAVSLLTLISSQLMAAECKTTIDSTDQMLFSSKAIVIDKHCKSFTVDLTHSGSLPVNVMGHNWVLAKEAEMQSILTHGIGSSESAAKIIAKTDTIGAGEKASVTFDVSKLNANDKYVFFCSFPGHVSMMKGTVILK